jgi:DNA processing protein
MNDEERAYALLLGLFEGGSRYWSQELARLGPELLVDRISSGAYSDISQAPMSLAQRFESLNITEIENQICASGSVLITPQSVNWPTRLDDLYVPPMSLIVKGNIDALGKLERSISIVGTRKPSSYGMGIATEFAAGMSSQGWVVVSGGAIGIDACAHRGALSVSGSTVVVLGSGVSALYPSTHLKLFREIQENGLLISEVLPQTKASSPRFLIRNRLIAALSQGTLVVEAAVRSGSLRTARDASEILRLVMAIPGEITSSTSDGCHRLIADHTAELVTSVDDLMELVGPLS